ncbi:MAG TPA: hypothetical protein VHC69_30360 [Polyangiaceae bacterium]|nr:hypothetical protein [Polyangiaceae bacterium]
MKFPFAIFLALTLASARVGAQQVDERTRSAARELAEQGATALQNGDTNGAIDKLERAYQIMHLPTVGLYSARALAKGGRLVDAAERYVDVTRWSGPSDARQAQAQADAARERDELLPRIPNVTLVIEGADPSDVTVTLDGHAVLAALVGAPQPVDPSHHVAKATRGTESVEQPFDIAEGQSLSVSLKFGAAPAAAAPPAPAAAPAVTAPAPPPEADKSSSGWGTQKIIAVSVAGAGLVSGIVAGVFTGSALSKKSDADKYCKGSACTDSRGVTLLDDARSAGNVATITGIAGIALIGAGAVLFFTAPSSKGPSVAVTPVYVGGGGSLIATGRF